jgi:erythromycin esterase-like protein
MNDAELSDRIRTAAEPLPEIDDPAFAGFIDRFADAWVALLGEASHGTSEFYRARAAITRRLIERHGFNIVAVEADWPDAACIDRSVRHKPPRDGDDHVFERFPTWMWRNTDVEAFTEWLKAHNGKQPPERMAGFYGLDLYNLGGSMSAVIDYLDDIDPEAAAHARERYGCLLPWSRDPAAYGAMSMHYGYALCEEKAVAMLRDLLSSKLQYAAEDADDFLDATMNARLVANAEAYYRVMYQGAAESWNLRDSHMFETLCAILDAKGEGAKAVVWAHNSHIGNAAHTDMGWSREEHNIGQLSSDHFGDHAVLVGFGTHSGTVAAATEWDGEIEVKRVRPSLPGSYERLSHDTRLPRFLLDLRGGQPDLNEALREPRLERFIGVIYRPDTERWSHYAESSLPGQFDAWLWFDETEAVTPIPTRQLAGEEETYPFGL